MQFNSDEEVMDAYEAHLEAQFDAAFGDEQWHQCVKCNTLVIDHLMLGTQVDDFDADGNGSQWIEYSCLRCPNAGTLGRRTGWMHSPEDWLITKLDQIQQELDVLAHESSAPDHDQIRGRQRLVDSLRYQLTPF